MAKTRFNSPPNMIRTTAVIEQGWNLGGMLGYSAGNGQTRFAFFTVDPWEKGWVTHAPYGQFDLEYGFADNFAVRLRVPLSFFSRILISIISL